MHDSINIIHRPMKTKKLHEMTFTWLTRREIRACQCRNLPKISTFVIGCVYE